MQHTVKQGESLSSIAHQYGFRDYKLVYNHPDNAGFRRKRPNPNLIYPGDVLTIPDKDTKQTRIVTNNKHKFVLKVAKRVLRVRFLNGSGKPMAGAQVDVVVEGGGAAPPKKTDGEGIVEVPVKPNSTAATVKIGERTIKLDLNHLNPLDDTDDKGISGLQARLYNLGYYRGPITNELDKSTAIAIALFQHDFQLKMTGEADDATIEKLVEEHGC